MTSLDDLLRQVDNASVEKLPPVEKWNPPLSGDIDIVIKANGNWWHEGGMIKRLSLVKLFASILKKEDEDYFLVTPVEKWKICVEDAPLLVTEMFLKEVQGSGDPEKEQKIIFKTATDDVFPLDADHPLRISLPGQDDSIRPYVRVRNGLDALIGRSVFYQLANYATSHQGQSGIWSGGCFFPLD